MKTVKTVLFLLGVTAVAAAGAAAGLSRFVNTPVRLARPVDVEVGRGESTHAVAGRLEREGVVGNATALLVLARITGRDREIRYGTHHFEGAVTPGAVLEELGRVPTPTVRVTIAEGSTLAEAAAEIERAGATSVIAYREAACDPALLAKLSVGPGANCAEGYLFPDTYNLAPGMSPAEIVRMQVERFEEVMGELLATAQPTPGNTIDLPAAAEARGPAVAKLVTLASIVEAEAKLDSERELISSVFHNRLARGMPLQADPTVAYGLDVAGTPWDRAALHRHLRTPTPYNTYTQTGLPPGPICNPGRAALRAALQPAATKYVYFVARGDGSHRFSATLAEHNRAVVDWRRTAREARIAAARAQAERSAADAAFVGPPAPETAAVHKEASAGD